MAQNNFQRMIAIINEVFETRNDPDQLQVTQEDQQKLHDLHPSTLSEYNEGNGPCVWVLLIPTTKSLMQEFLGGKISENQLLQKTNTGDSFESIYLCSATTLPEYRNKGITSRITLEAIQEIRKTHPVSALFVWPFTEEGKHLAERIAEKAMLPLFSRSL